MKIDREVFVPRKKCSSKNRRHFQGSVILLLSKPPENNLVIYAVSLAHYLNLLYYNFKNPFLEIVSQKHYSAQHYYFCLMYMLDSCI